MLGPDARDGWLWAHVFAVSDLWELCVPWFWEVRASGGCVERGVFRVKCWKP